MYIQKLRKLNQILIKQQNLICMTFIINISSFTELFIQEK